MLDPSSEKSEVLNVKPKAVSPLAAGAGGGLLVFWLWNEFVPGHPMPAEVGIVVATAMMAVTGPIHRRLERWGRKGG